MHRARTLRCFLPLQGRIIQASNQLPRAALIANRDVGWAYVADLEPKARAAFENAIQNPPGKKYSAEVAPPMAWEFAKANQEGRKPVYQKPQQDPVERFYRRFEAAKQDDPSLTASGFWQQLKDENPAILLDYILTFDPQTFSVDVQGGSFTEPVGEPNEGSTERAARRRIVKSAVKSYGEPPSYKANARDQAAVGDAVEFLS